jgi:hypothetical protein
MKDEEIAELKAKMDDMAEEFGEMLRVSSPPPNFHLSPDLTKHSPQRKHWRKCAKESKYLAIILMAQI